MAASLIGTTVDGYRIVDVIGRGGMGTVYRAVDEALDKVVALKMMAPRLAEDATFLARFKAEAKALARLDAPGIVRVLALRETEHGLFIVMEYVDGPTLDTILQRHAPIDWREALPLIRQMLEAIAHAHDSDVLHRDLKPSNILLNDDGQVKMTDFGLAKIQADGSDLTSTHETAGTLHYMSPEQIQGLRHVDARSDLFALGLIIYEMLTGRLPFERTASNYAIQRAIVEERLPPPTAFNADLPDELGAIVDRLLAKAPDDRFPDAHAVLDALLPLEAALSAPPSAPSWTAQDAAPSRKQGLATALVLALGGVLLLGGAFLAIRWLLQPPVPSPDVTTETASDPSSAGVTDAGSPPTRLSIASTPSGATVYLEGDSVGTTPLDTIRRAATSTALRLVHPGYQPFDTVLAADTSAQTITATLSPTPATTSSPAPLRITSDDGEASETDDAPNPSAPRDRPAPPRTGVLIATSTPSGAEVRIDGQVRGTTPLTLSALRTGRYAIELHAAGHQTYRTTATLPVGDTLRIAPALNPTPAILRVRVVPFGRIAINGMVRLDNSDVALTDTLAPGTYQVQATYRNLTWTHSITLAPGESVQRVIDFTQTITVGVTAETAEGERLPNAEVLVDGEPQGFAPMQLALRVGDHTVTVRKDGYVPTERALTVDETLEGPLVFQLNAR